MESLRTLLPLFQYLASGLSTHTEKYFQNIIKSTRNLIAFTMHRLICNSERTDRGDSFPFNFVPNGFPFGSKSI